MAHEILLPEGWPRPRGYSNGVAAEGRTLYVAGQIGWDTEGKFPDPTFAAQFRKALENTLAVLKAGGAGPEHVVRMTWFITDKVAYMTSLKEIGAAWRDLFGQHYPAMAVVVVSALIEDEAKVEIETTAVIPA
jgi:enamine deaminase RidA (YjgF/YER057c/UK114 family)